ERLLDIICALLCIGVGLVMLPDSTALSGEATSSIGIFIVLALVLGVGLLLTRPIHPYLLNIWRFILRPFPFADKLVRFAEDTLLSLQTIAAPRPFAIAFGWSCVVWVGYVLFFQVGLYAFLANVPLGVGFLVTGF